jgi:hypothetical protein
LGLVGLSALERYAVALASGATSGSGAEILEAAQEMSELGEGLVRLRDANQADQFERVKRSWEKTSRRLLYRAGYRLNGGTQKKLARDSLRAWAFAICAHCKGARVGCEWCAGLGSTIPEQWSEGESRRVFEAAIAFLDSRYSDAVRALYRVNRRASDD